MNQNWQYIQVNSLLLMFYIKYGTRFFIWSIISGISIFLLTSGGCGRPVNQAEISDMNSEHPAFRAVALHKTVEQGNTDHLAQQVELLADEDPAVRFYAIMSLKKLTGTDNGYNYSYDASRRREAIERWQQWLTINRETKNPATGAQ